jgi:diguanylate cyclase (GGDEF)-like protein/PAS domain S-box-containing protein
MSGLTVGVLSPYLTGGYFGALVAAIGRVVWKAGGRVVAVQTARPGMELREGSAAKTPARVGWDHIGGFVVVGDAVPPGYLAELARSGKAVVAIGHEAPGISCPVVSVDNRGGIERAVEHLLWHGHERIAFAGCLQTFDTRERYDAYRSTLRAHGIEPEPALFFEAPDNVEFGGLEAGRSMLAAGLPSSAVVAATDLNAIGITKALRSAGYTLPEDQAVTGFDNSVGSALAMPALSTASQDVDHLGTTAAELLLRRLGGEEIGAERHVVGAPFLVRESCGCPTAKGGRAACAGVPDGRDPVSWFNEALARAPWAARGAGAGETAELAGEVARLFSRAAEEQLSASDLGALRRACEALYQARPSQSTTDLVFGLAERLGAALGEHAGDGEVAERLDQCRAWARFGLMRAALNESTEAYYAMRRAVREEYLITIDLMAGRQDNDPRSLSWLGRTEALAGVLGLWERGTGATPRVLGEAPAGPRGGDRAPGEARAEHGGQLQLVSTFTSDGSALGLRQVSCNAPSFPPEQLLSMAEEGRVAAVVPVSSEQTDWGWLAMVAPADPASIGQDMYFMWAALFAEVLGRHELTASLERSEQRYALAVRASNDGLWDWDLASGRVYYSERWKEMLGLANGAIGEGPAEWLDRVHPEDRPSLLGELSGLKEGKKDKVLVEHRVRTGEGSYIWVLCRALAVPGEGALAARLVGSLTDVTERHVLEDQLRHQALYDSLTGLPNRALFMDRLSQAVAAARRSPRHCFAVLWLDLDNFKELNDTRGHLAGDELLVEVARRISSNLRATDTAARFGGDEFAVLVPSVSTPAVFEVSERILGDLRAPYSVGGQHFFATASVGVVIGTGAYERPEDVIRDADIAMYRAKAAGRDGTVMFSPMGWAS